MKKLMCLILFILVISLLTAGMAESASLPGVLADFTETASTVTNVDCRSYEHFFFDYDGDGEEEMFYLAGLSSNDGTWPLSATIFTGPDSHSLGWSPPKKIPDTAEIRTVCFIDINPDDGRKDLVISVVASDGAEYTTILQGVDKHSDDAFGRQWKDGSDRAIFSGLFRGITEDGVLLIGNTLYTWDEKYWVKEIGTQEAGDNLFPETVPVEESSPEPASEPTAPLAETAEPTTPPAVSEPSAAPASVPSGEGDAIQTDVRYTGVAFFSQGLELDPLVMPEYAVTFHADGTATFILASNELPTLHWETDGADRVIEYAKQILRFVPEGDGLTVDVLGTITVRMRPE